jgi:hypothetical protein
MSADELLTTPVTPSDRPDYELAAQSTSPHTASTMVVAVHTCDRLCRPANPPSRGVAFTEWWQRATRPFRRR